MRRKHKLGALFLVLLIGTIAVVTWHRRDRPDEGTASASTNGATSSPLASPAGSRADTDGVSGAAPLTDTPAGAQATSGAEGTRGEPSKPVVADDLKRVRSGVQPKAARAGKAKHEEARPAQSAGASAQDRGESSPPGEA
ncbi:MAG: hypothetical protein ACREOE_14775, partial [Gemmatimonadales bacterium]